MGKPKKHESSDAAADELNLETLKDEGYNSSSSDITCGVPQGSILGLLLFLVYINDLCNVSKVLELILFADDNNIFYSHTDASYLIEVVNLELK